MNIKMVLLILSSRRMRFTSCQTFENDRFSQDGCAKPNGMFYLRDVISLFPSAEYETSINDGSTGSKA